MNTKPQLEIFADDVKCTHGATVGQLDADSLFYLQARGLDREHGARPAHSRLCRRHRRAREVRPLRERLDRWLLEQIPQDAVA